MLLQARLLAEVDGSAGLLQNVVDLRGGAGRERWGRGVLTVGHVAIGWSVRQRAGATVVWQVGIVR